MAAVHSVAPPASLRDTDRATLALFFRVLSDPTRLRIPLHVAVVPGIVRSPPLGLLVAALLVIDVGIHAILLCDPVYRRAVTMAERLRPLRRFDAELRNLRPAFRRLFHAHTIAGVLGYIAAAAALQFLLFQLALQAVGATQVGFARAALIYAVGHILSGLTMLPGGLGAYEGLLTGFLVLEGVAPSQGAAAALLYRGFNDVLMAALGVHAGLGLRRRIRRRRAFLGLAPGEPLLCE